MQYFGFDRPSFGIKTFGFGANFDPLDLFKDGKQGVWYDPSDKSTLFQDVAGTVPVTKDGDPVALMRDKSGNGNHAMQTVSTARPAYKTDGILHWLDFDGVDDGLLSTGIALDYSQFTLSAGIMRSSSGIPFETLSKTLYIYAGGIAATGDGWLVGTRGKGSETYRFFASEYSNGATSVLSMHQSSEFVVRINSTALYNTTTNSYGNVTDRITIGRRGVDEYAAKCRIYGIIYISKNASGITEVEQYIATKSGVTL